MEFYMIQYVITILPILLESFPISSSGHAKLILDWYNHFYYFSYNVPKNFDHLLHGPIACIVALFFFERWSFLLFHIKRTWPYIIKIIFFGIITELITIICYGLYSCIDCHIYYLPFGFLVTAALLFSLLYCPVKREKKIYTITDAALLGLMQGMALLPGISRFAATFVCARWLGFSDKKSFELSFLIEWPISLAGFFKGLYSLRTNQQLDLLNSNLLFAMLLASIGAWFGFYLVSKIVYKKKLWLFSPYVACIGILAAMINR